MNNPFDLANYKSTLSFSDLEKARRNAYQATRHVNEQRKRGIEPSSPYANSPGGLPQDYATEMPELQMHKRSVERSKANKEKKQ